VGGILPVRRESVSPSGARRRAAPPEGKRTEFPRGGKRISLLVEFTALASPGNLPGGNEASPPFVTSADLSADSDPPAQPLGVNPGEQLVVTFTLLPGKSYADAIAGLADGSLRVGIHVQGYQADGSESFVNTPVPEPGTLTLVGAGLFVLGAVRRRRS